MTASKNIEKEEKRETQRKMCPLTKQMELNCLSKLSPRAVDAVLLSLKKRSEGEFDSSQVPSGAGKSQERDRLFRQCSFIILVLSKNHLRRVRLLDGTEDSTV